MEPNATYAVLVLCARDVDKIFDGMRAANPGGNPTVPAAPDGTFGYLTAANFEALGQIRCDDAYILKNVNCYFGLLLRCTAAVHPFAVGDYLVAVRGTVTPLEWADDASSEVPVPANGVVGQVGAGFWGVYSTMTFADMQNAKPRPGAAEAIANLVKTAHAPLWVTGHSLGAALATYLAADLQKQLAGTDIPLRPYFFASPRPGSQDYADNYQATIAAYDLVNYVADLVPNLPSNPPFYTLNSGGASHNVHTIPQGLPGAPAPTLDPLTNIANNHSPVTYAKMLDPNNTVAPRFPP